MKLPRRISELFKPEEDIDFQDILTALGDVSVRHSWVMDLSKEIQRINQEVDQRVMAGRTDFADLSGRRKGIQYALETALSIHRAYRSRRLHNRGGFDLDSVTVQSAPK